MSDLTSEQIGALHEAFAKEGYTPSEAHNAIEEHRKSLKEGSNEPGVIQKSLESINKLINESPFYVPPLAVAGLGAGAAATPAVAKGLSSIASRMFGKKEDLPRIDPLMDVNQQPTQGRIEPTFEQAPPSGMQTATPEQMQRYQSHPVFQENPSLVTEEQFSLQQQGLKNREANIANAVKPTSNMPLNPVNPTDQLLDVNNPKPTIQAQSAQNQALGQQMANDPNVQHEVLVEQVKQGVPPNTPVNPASSNESLQTVESLANASQNIEEKGAKPPLMKEQPVKATRLRGEAKVQADELAKINKGYNQYSQKLGGMGDIPNKASSILQPQFDNAWEDLHKNVFKGVNPKSQSGNPQFWDDAVKHLQAQPEKYKDILDFMERNQKDYGSKGAALQKGFSNFGLMAGGAGAGLAGLGLYQAFKHGMNTGDWSNLGLGVADTAAAFKLPNPMMIPWSLATHVGGLNTNEGQDLQYRRQVGGGRGVAPPNMEQR